MGNSWAAKCARRFPQGKQTILSLRPDGATYPSANPSWTSDPQASSFPLGGIPLTPAGHKKVYKQRKVREKAQSIPHGRSCGTNMRKLVDPQPLEWLC